VDTPSFMTSDECSEVTHISLRVPMASPFISVNCTSLFSPHFIAHDRNRGLWSARASIAMRDVMRDPKLACSERVEESPFYQVYGMPFWEWLALPENELTRKNFDISMSTHSALYPSDAIAKGE
jgi:hypothetical protein